VVIDVNLPHNCADLAVYLLPRFHRPRSFAHYSAFCRGYCYGVADNRRRSQAVPHFHAAVSTCCDHRRIAVLNRDPFPGLLDPPLAQRERRYRVSTIRFRITRFPRFSRSIAVRSRLQWTVRVSRTSRLIDISRIEEKMYI